LQIDNLDW